MDAVVRERMRRWPQTPPGLENTDPQVRGAWLRARPCAADDAEGPSVKIPGARRMRTFPDGLWFWFGGTPADPYVDLFAIEVCGSLQNLLDKRSRYAPSLHSLLATCPASWLKRAMPEYGAAPRWQVTGLLPEAPDAPLVLPVRDIRVMYALKPRLFRDFAAHSIAHAHELFAPIDILLDEAGWRAPGLRRFLGHAARRANFWDPDSVAAGEASREMSREAWRRNLPAGGFDQVARAVGPVGNDAVDAESEQPVDVGGRVHGPGEHAEAERMRLAKIAFLEARLKRRPEPRAGRGDRTRELAAELI
jgi:hypothetical protein